MDYLKNQEENKKEYLEFTECHYRDHRTLKPFICADKFDSIKIGPEIMALISNTYDVGVLKKSGQNDKIEIFSYKEGSYKILENLALF